MNDITTPVSRFFLDLVNLAVQFSFNIAVNEIPIPERTRMRSKARRCVSKFFAEWDNSCD